MRGPERLDGLLRPTRRDPSAEERIDLEIRSHLAMRVDELVDQGYEPEEARRIAREAFGDLERYREECRALADRREVKRMWKQRMLSVGGDVMLALRQMTRWPGQSLAIMLTLGLGVGASTTIFTVADAALLEPLAFEDGGELVTLHPVDAETGRFRSTFPLSLAEAWASADLFAATALYRTGSRTRTDVELSPDRRVAQVSWRLPGMLGADPLLGRGFVADDARAGSAPVVLLSEPLWTRDFGADPDVLGRSIELDGVAHTVVGVMPADFRFPRPISSEAWIPLRNGAAPAELSIVARRPPGVSTEALQAQVDVLAARFAEAGMTRAPLHDAELRPLDWFRATDEVRGLLTAAGGGVALLLLIALANGVNLLLVRGSERWRELAVRSALGASRARLLRQLLVESLAVALVSSVIALAIAYAGVQAFRVLAPPALELYSPHPIEIDGRVLTFTFGLTLLAGTLFGMLPGLGIVRRASVQSGVARGAGGSTGRGPRAIVVAEVGVSVVLLVSAGLFITSLQRLVSTDPGFDPGNLLYFTPDLRSEDMEPLERLDAYLEMQSAIAALPGVEGVALSNGTPLGGSSFYFAPEIRAEDRGPGPVAQPTALPWTEVDPDLLALLGARLVSGRWPMAGDAATGGVVIDEPLAELLWPRGPAVGRRFRLDDDDWLTVVGVVEDVRSYEIDDRRGRYDLFLPLPLDGSFVGTTWSIVARVAEPWREEVVGAVRDIGLRYKTVGGFSQLEWAPSAIRRQTTEQRFTTVIVLALSVLAAFLTAVGLYGVLSYGVRLRWREMGIRMALGASAGGVRGMIVAQGLKWIVYGLALGLVGAVLAARVIRDQLYRTEALEPLAYGSVAVAMVLIGIASCLAPAFRATRVDPVRVLNAD